MAASLSSRGLDPPRPAVRWCSPRLVRLSGAGLAEGGQTPTYTEDGHAIIGDYISDILGMENGSGVAS